MGQGHKTSRIAEEMKVSMKTVQAYCARIKEKLGLPNAAELARAAVRWVVQARSQLIGWHAGSPGVVGKSGHASS